MQARLQQGWAVPDSVHMNLMWWRRVLSYPCFGAHWARSLDSAWVLELVWESNIVQPGQDWTYIGNAVLCACLIPCCTLFPLLVWWLHWCTGGCPAWMSVQAERWKKSRLLHV